MCASIYLLFILPNSKPIRTYFCCFVEIQDVDAIQDLLVLFLSILMNTRFSGSLAPCSGAAFRRRVPAPCSGAVFRGRVPAPAPEHRAVLILVKTQFFIKREKIEPENLGFHLNKKGTRKSWISSKYKE